MADYELELHLIAHGFSCSPDDITNILGLSPDRVRSKGEIVRNNVKAKRSYWWLDSPASPENSSIDAQWTALAERLGERRNQIKNLPEDAEVFSHVVVNAYKYMPDIDVSAELMKELADLNLKMRISIYDLIEDEQNEN